MEVIPLSDTLAAIAPAIPSGLVAAAALDRVCAVAQRLPAALTSTVYLECRLTPDASHVDVILGIGTQGRDIIAGRNPAIPVPEVVHHDQTWSRVARLCQQWAHPRSELHDSIEGIWLEFDLDSWNETRKNAVSGEQPVAGCREADAAAATSIPVPGLFVDFLRKNADRQGSRRNDLDLALAIMDELSPGHRPRWSEHPVHRCFDLLPEGCWVPYIGVFPARPGETVRFCVRELDPRQRLKYLRAIDWPGAEHLGSTIRLLAGHWAGAADKQGAVLHLDVGFSELGPKLGLEYYLERLPQLRGELVELAFLEHLVQLGLCSASKLQGLLAWPGYEVRHLPHELWPSLVQRRVNHIKLVHDERHLIEAKAYLCITHAYHERVSRRSPSIA